MQLPTYDQLLEAGVHFGHLKRKWNPNMKPYIFMERQGIHVIDLNKTQSELQRAGSAMKQIAKSGRKIMFVATKKQASEFVSHSARSVNMPFVTDRWLGGMMTNFATIRRSVKKMKSIEKMLADGSLSNITKKERLTLTRERDKLHQALGGVVNLNRIPSAIFIVDIFHEHLAVAEAQKLGLTTFGIVDTNSDPNQIDFPIPGNDDAAKSVEVITKYLTGCIKEGLEERKAAKDKKEEEASV